jgi:O-antigen/teichoic acid export membrane protein
LLKAKAKNAVFWSMFSTVGGIVIQMGYGVIMARLLTPYDFGLIAMAMVIITICKSFVDSGFYQAVIQKKEVNSNELSAILNLNLVLALVLCSSILLFSNNLADFFGEQNLIEIFSILAFTLLVEAFSLVPRAVLVKEIQFKLVSKIAIFSTLISSIVGVILALNDFGVYSLVYKSVLQIVLSTSFYWIFHPIKINFFTSFKYLKGFFNFGSKVFIADQIEVISNQITFGLIGKKFNSSDLGYFSKAFQYQGLLSQTIVVSINKVVFPTFSKVQDDDVKLKNGYRVLMRISAFFILPLMLISLINGNELIIILLGDQWGEAIPYFKILCIGGVFYPFTVFNLNIIKVKGLGGLYLKTCLISKGILVPAVLIGLNFGITGVAIAIIAQQIFAAIVNSIFSGKLINYTFSQQIKDVSPFFISAILAVVPGLLIYSYLASLHFIYSITITSLLFILIYFCSLFLLAKSELILIYKTIVKT